MATELILSFIADDRPGLVKMISHTVTDTGGNWLESRMAHLAEKFAGIVRIELPDDKSASVLKSRFAAMKNEGILVTVAEAGKSAKTLGATLALDLIGPDHPGIVQEITQCLAARQVSIETMETSTADAPMGGGQLFQARIEVRGPTGLDEEALRGELEHLADALMVDLDLQKVNAADAG